MFRAVAPLIESSCDLSTYPVLAPVSRRCPGHMGRLPTCYSPVRHWLPKKASFSLPSVRLACIRHAASVHPEPGSNSPFDFSSRCHLTSIVSSFQNWRFVLGFFYSVRFSKISFSHRFACLIILPQPGGLCKLFFQAFFYQIRSPLAPVYISKYPPPMSNTFFTFFYIF